MLGFYPTGSDALGSSGETIVAMTIEENLKALLGPLVSGRAYPNRFPQQDGLPDLWPAIRYSFVDTVYDEDICGFSADDDSSHRIQVDVVDKTYDGMRALRRAVLAALPTFDPPIVPQLAFEDYEPDEKRHRFVVQFITYP